jgi:hypothetical protein
MSGRLIILPKKAYCPWKPENVERVLKDERVERERLEKEEKEQRQQESKQRLATLKGGDSSTPKQQEQHVNLFELEERAMVETSLTGEEKKKRTELTGVMPVRLDSVMRKNKDQPFYVRGSVARNDQKWKARMDPMKAFTREEPRRAEKNGEGADDRKLDSSSRKNRPRKPCSRYDGSDSEDSGTRRLSRQKRHDRKRRKWHSQSESIEELRRRRQEREQKESQREEALRRQSGARYDRSRHYQDQFHPSLSHR